MQKFSHIIFASLAALPKKEVSRSVLEKDLGLATSVFGKYGRKSGERKMFFREDESYIYVPRNYIHHKGFRTNHLTDERIIGDPINPVFTKELRDYQKDFIEVNRDIIDEQDDIIMEAGCGSGKTCMSLYLITMRKRKTIVLVPTNFLAAQYKSRLDDFLDGVDVVLAEAKQKKIAWENADILIISYDLFKSRKFPVEFYYHFGHLVIDEGHRMGADTHEETTARFHTKYRTMLTATFRREDGGQKILKHHFGEVIKMPRVNPDVDVHATATGIRIGELFSLRKVSGNKFLQWQDFLEKMAQRHNVHYTIVDGIVEIYLLEDRWERIAISDFNLKSDEKIKLNQLIRSCKAYVKNPQFSTLDSFVSALKLRNHQILSLTHRLLKDGRKILLLGKRKAQLYALKKKLSAQGIKTLVIVSETLKKMQSEGTTDVLTQQADVVLGIDKLAKEGMDVDTLDTMILIHPVGDVEQAMGRIARIKEGKKTPKMFYLIDDTMAYKMIFRKSAKFITNAGVIANRIQLRKPQ